MDSHTLSENLDFEFQPGAPVVYALHGKCQVISIENKSLNGKPIQFYKLEVRRSNLARTTRPESAIWVPVSNASNLGLRRPMDPAEADEAMKALSSREYFFDLDKPWKEVHLQLETSIRDEGGLGLAKAVSYLFVLKSRQIVPAPDVVKFYESVHRLLFKELSEVLGEPARVIEEKVSKAFRAKLLPDH